MDSSLEQVEARAPWYQLPTERDMQYAWFSSYAELGAQRTLASAARRTGTPIAAVREAATLHRWDERVAAYDAAVIEVSKTVAVDDAEALATQFAMGQVMLRLAIQGIQAKNPSLLKLKDIITLMTEGSEMMRRGAGVADMKTETTVIQRVENEFRDLLGD